MWRFTGTIRASFSSIGWSKDGGVGIRWGVQVAGTRPGDVVAVLGPGIHGPRGLPQTMAGETGHVPPVHGVLVP